MLLDIILAIIILVNLLLGLKRGLIVMLGRLATLIIIAVIVLSLSGPLTETLAKAPFLQPLTERLGDSILQPLADSAANIGTAIESLGLPDMIADLLQSQLPTPDNAVSQVLPEFSETLVQFLLNALVYIVLFIVIIVVISLLTRLLTRAADKVAVIGTSNRLGGLLLGAVIGFVQVSILLLVLGFLAPVWAAAAGWIDSSRIAGWFYAIDILALIF